METCSQSFGEQVDQDSWGPASPKAFWHPEFKPPQPSSLQGPDFEDVMARRSSTRLQEPSGVDNAPVHQLDMQPFWDLEPRFWQDVLTQQLWQIFAGTYDKVDQPRHRRESP